MDEEGVRAAIQQQQSFNIIHKSTFFKVDFFPATQSAFSDSQFARRIRSRLGENPGDAAYIASAEDLILAKLEWYRMGGEVSERQLADIQGIIGAQGARLDAAYLQKWASTLGVQDLLNRMLAGN